MTHPSRRTFLMTTALGASAGLSPRPALGSANDKIVVGVIGLGGQGMAHLAGWKSLPNVEVKYVCDVDDAHFARAAKAGGGASPVADLRRILDDKSVDAVSIATPDHWHTPAALLALASGKHVYVEKPCSHNVKEGRLLVDAAKRTGKLVQHGTQSRSSPYIQAAIRLLREGVIGDVVVAKAWDVQFRPPIGKAKPGDPPKGFDYEAWVGPAPMVPFQSNRHHYTWHWWRNFGTGDAGNDGVHEMDIARWGMGVETQPSTVAAIGGKYVHDDDQEFPDTLTAVFEYPGSGNPGDRRQLVYEMRLWSRYHPETTDNGNEFLGTKGRMYLAKKGEVKVFDESGRPKAIDLPKDHNFSVALHQQNFLNGIRTGSPVNADALTGHLSASLPHLANLSARLGRSLKFDPKSETIVGDPEAAKFVGREYRQGHWAAPKA